MAPSYVSPGTLLALWLAKSGVTQAWLAERLGVSQPSVAQWISGANRPGRVYAEALETVAGIASRAWFDDDERDVLRRAVDGPVSAEQADTSQVALPK